VPDALRNLLRELNAILAAARRRPGIVPVDPAVIERIQEFVLTWSANVRPGLAAIKVPQELLNRADRLTSKLARLTSGNPSKKAIAAALRRVSDVLNVQIVLEVARIPPGVQAAFPAPATMPPLFPEISDLPNQLVPFAVQGWSERINAFLKEHSFSKNVFIMVSYRSNLELLIEAVKEKLTQLHLNPVLARDHTLTNDLYNPIACLLCCSYGVAIFDRAETTQMHNPNVVYELGMMQLLKRQCVILKHKSLKRMPTDLLSMLYEDYSRRKEAVQKLSDWWVKINP
jgi:hypothetical protein